MNGDIKRCMIATRYGWVGFSPTKLKARLKCGQLKLLVDAPIVDNVHCRIYADDLPFPEYYCAFEEVGS